MRKTFILLLKSYIMAEHNELGKEGEKMAREYLIEKGFKIIDTNWRFGSDEIDIVAKYNNYMVVVEVKSRKSSFIAEPEIAVNKAKQKFLIRAAQQYAVQRNVEEEIRFDIVSIVMGNDKPIIKHIEDAFYPTL